MSIGWDEYFMSLVYLVAMKSKDEATNIGAVIVGPDNEIRSTGYNSFPRGMNDNNIERQERPHKYYFFEHAERNAIYNAVRHGTSLKNCILYVQGIPCSDCARGVIQAGIKEVVYHDLWEKRDKADKWKKNAEMSLEMFAECGVNFRSISKKLISNIMGYNRGDYFDI